MRNMIAPFSDVAPELLSRGADPDVQDKYGHSPLHRAASKGLEKMTEILLQVFPLILDNKPIRIFSIMPLHLAEIIKEIHHYTWLVKKIDYPQLIFYWIWETLIRLL